LLAPFLERMKFFNQLLMTAKPYSLQLLALAKAHGQQLWALSMDYSQSLRALVARHPQHVTAAVAAVLLGGGGGAFAVANLGPDASNLPVRTLVETLETPNLEAQVAALEQQTLRLYARKFAAPLGFGRFRCSRFHSQNP
jgi:hypothetical protein